jgi:hypothetical protein
MGGRRRVRRFDGGKGAMSGPPLSEALDYEPIVEQDVVRSARLTIEFRWHGPIVSIKLWASLSQIVCSGHVHHRIDATELNSGNQPVLK